MRTIKNPVFDAPENDPPEDIAAVGETSTAHEVLQEVDRLLAPLGLEVVIHEPTVHVDVVHWGFTIEPCNV